MWLIYASFDGNEQSKPTPRLLKPGHKYGLGRKEKPLTIPNKKISKDLCEFQVGEHSIEDASDPKVVPVLEVLNQKNKSMGVCHDGAGEESKEIQPFQKVRLKHGDSIQLTHGFKARVEWKPICAYLPSLGGKGLISIDDCASLGIKLVYRQNPGTTHHLLSRYAANLSTATSLLSLAYFVKPEWLQEVIRLGTDGEGVGTSSLEQNFVLPSESKYRPAFSPSLLPAQKKLNIWEPSEERFNLFAKCRFVCFHEKVRDSDSELREAIHRGEGTLENFDVHSGVQKFRRSLTRGHAKEGKKVVVIADVDSMLAAVGKEGWQEYVDEAKSFKLEIKSPSLLIQAVLNSNVEPLLSEHTLDEDGNKGHLSRNLSPLPEVVPNSIFEEPSINVDSSGSQAPPPARKLVRRVTRSASREPSIAPSMEPENVEEPIRPRKPLIRRVVTTTPIITGLDDPSSVIDPVPVLPRHTTPPPDIFDYTAPTPARSTRLKRRVGVANADNKISMLSGIAETIEEEPPLKKFKALFDATNPDTMGYGSLNELESQTQSGIESHMQRMDASMPVFREEEEEGTQSAAFAAPSQRGQKRRLEDVDVDVEMDAGDEPANEEAAPPSKKRTMDHSNAVQRDILASTTNKNKPPSTLAPSGTKGQGAPAGKPDTDTAFLKAIASTKRGKKAEDAFDREFNQLRISKPDVEPQRDPEEVWGVLAEFGDDSGLRGNFMTIVEMDLFRKDGQQRRAEANMDWDGKPDFKKFKKKITGPRKAKVEVFLDGGDFAMGPTWKNANSQGQSQSQNQEFDSQEQSLGNFNMESQGDFGTQPKDRSRFGRDADTLPPATQKSRKPPSKVVPLTQKRASAKSKVGAKNAKNALFLDSDDEVQDLKEDGDDDDESQTLRSSARRQPPPLKKPSRGSRTVKPKALIVDDSDDDATFKGFRGRH